MKNSFARAILQVLALLTGLAVATVWRDQHNLLIHYPELRSSKTELGLGVNGAQSFLRTPVSLANGALNLAAWFGHQEILVDREWQHVPEVSFRVRAAERSEVELEFLSRSVRTALRLSNRPVHPSAWLTVQPDGTFVEKVPVRFELPKGQWVRIHERMGAHGITVEADGEPVTAERPVSATVPAKVLLRGDSASGRLLVDDVRISDGGETYEQSFTGEMPWLLFLLAIMVASLAFFAVEKLTTPRAAATASSVGFLVLCALLALYRGGISDRYPVTVDLRGVPSHIETRPEALARLKALPEAGKPVLLWLGGSQAWGAGASKPESTAFALLRDKLAKGSGLEWVNGAISGARLADQKEALDAVLARRKVAFVILIAGVNDANNRAFPAGLEAFAAAVRTAGARLFLVAEPVETESADIGQRQSQLVGFAKSAGLPFAEPEPVFRAHADDGYLWWDFVHLTDAGARIEAEALEMSLAAALGGAAQR